MEREGDRISRREGQDIRMRLRALVALLLLNAGTGTVVGAQSRSNAYMDVSIGANALLGSPPYNGEYYDNEGSVFVLLAFGGQPNESRSFMGALHVGLLTMASGDDSCRLTPLGGCYRDFPLGGMIAITVGGRPLTSPWRVLELTAGPALVGQVDNGTSFGALAVGRIGLPPGNYLSPGLAFHGIVTGVHGAVVFSAGVGLSLRTW